MTFYIRIAHMPSAEILHDGPLGDYTSIEEATDRIIEEIFCGELSRAEPDGVIPSGCADYRTEIRTTKTGEDWRCWEALDWFADAG